MPAILDRPVDRLLTRKEAAAFLGLAEQTLAVWGMSGRHLPVVKVGRSVRYKLRDLQKFVQEQTIPASA